MQANLNVARGGRPYSYSDLQRHLAALVLILLYLRHAYTTPACMLRKRAALLVTA